MKRRISLARQLGVAMAALATMAIIVSTAAFYLVYGVLERLRVVAPLPPGVEDTTGLDIGITLAACVAGGIVAVAIGVRVARRIVRPLGAVGDAARRIAEGDLATRIDPSAEAHGETALLIADFNAMADRLQRMSENVQVWNAKIAHELRTPLASTMINLEDAMASAGPDDTQTALEAARACLVSLARRTEQLLALARLEAGAASGPRTPVDIAELAQETLDELSPILERGGVELGIRALPEGLVVEGYPVALGAMLRNLLENAFRHAPPGGHVELSIARGDDSVVVEVVDDGPGIPADRRASMFTRFERGVDTQHGYGLGLSIVQRAAELHDARVELLDREGGTGLRAVIRIPLAR
jgi:two-component system sensor histidine kinase QseC